MNFISGNKMLIEFYDPDTRQYRAVRAEQLVVYLDQGTPVMAAAPVGGRGSYEIATARDPEFADMIRRLGVRQSVNLQIVKPAISGSKDVNRQF